MIIGRAAFAAPDEPDRPPRPERLGVVYLTGVVIASVVATLFALATRLELTGPAQTIMSAEAFRQVALLRDVVFTFAVALPSVAALGHLLVPTLGATAAARRLDRLAVGAHALGAGVLLTSTTLAGWPWLLALTLAMLLLAAGGVVQAVGFVVRLSRAPAPTPSPFVDALWVAAVTELVALPVAMALLAALFVERLTGTALWHGAGADPLAYEHWLRVVVQPLGLVALLPALGVIGDALAAATGQPLPGARVVRGATSALALLGGAAWLAHLFGDGAGAAAVGSFFALALAAPLSLVVGNWLVALGGGVRAPGATLWFALAAMVLWVELAVTGLPLAVLDVGGPLAGTAFAQAREELLFATLGFSVAAALHRVWPTLIRRAYAENAARAACAVGFVGVQLAVVPDLVAGVRGMPRAFAYPAQFRAAEIVAAAGTLLWIGAAAAIAAYLLASARRRQLAARPA